MRNDASKNKRMHSVFRPLWIVLAAGLLMVFGPLPVVLADCGLHTVMPIGDSLTLGFSGSEPGYRATYDLNQGKGLYELLADAGLTIDYVGSQSYGFSPCEDWEHESAMGRRITDINSLINSGEIDFTGYNPNIILLMAGTNDFFRRYEKGFLNSENGYKSYYCTSTPDKSFAKLVADELLKIDGQTKSGLVEDIFKKLPLTQLFVASIPPIDIDASGYFRLSGCTEKPTHWSQTDLDKEIQYFNQLIKERVNQDGRQNLHFVDVWSALNLEDYNDGVHPKDLITYHKVAKPWFAAIVDLYRQSFWDVESGTWNNSQNWRNGLQQPELPGKGNNIYLTQDDDTDREVVYDSTDDFLFSRLTIDATEKGDMTFLQNMNKFTSVLEVIGDEGYGEVFQSGGSATIDSITLGNQAGGEGNYILTNSASLDAVTENIGRAGTGYFIQGGGTNNILRQLLVGWPSGTSGTYDLRAGELSANEEFIGSRQGEAVFTQTGGINSVEVKTPTAGGVEGTLWIASAGDSSKPGIPYTYSGTYIMAGDGVLTAKRIVNGDLFYYAGGQVTVTDNFTNNGTLEVVGPRSLNGPYVQNSTGQLSINIVAGNPGQLNVTGTATLKGYVKLCPGGEKKQCSDPFNPSVGDSFDILTADNGVKGFGVGLFKQPASFLGTDKFLRPSLVGRTVHLSVVSADLNKNGAVDCGDLATVKDNLGKRSGQPGFHPFADINGDGVVDVRDLSIITQKLPAGTRCP
jgi:hypothetical protein